MGIFSDSLLGTQQPPDGSPEPGGVAGFAKAAQPLQTATPRPSFSEAILGGGQQSAPAQEQGQKADERGWLRKGYDAIIGPKDPNYEGVGSLASALDAEQRASGNFFNSQESKQFNLGLGVAGDDKALADIAKNALGSRFVRHETDANGYGVVVFKGADGKEQKAYVNKPGLDTEDVGRAVIGSLPYLGVGALTGGIGPLVLRTIGTGLGMAGTSAGLDLASTGLGSEQGIDTSRAAVVGALGAAGEPAGALLSKAWQKFVTVPGLFDKKAGALTDKGREAASKLGLEPDMLVGKIGEEFSKIYAAAPDAVKKQLGEQFSAKTLGIPSTLGQRTKDAEQLLQEKAMRYGVYGENAKGIIQEFDKRQAEALKNAALGAVDPAQQGVPGVAARLAPHRNAADVDPASLGQGIRSGMEAAKAAAKEQERAAWAGVTDIMPKQEAFEMLPQSVAKALEEFRVDKDTMPVAYSMAKKLEDYMGGKAAQEELKVLGNNASVPTIDEMRRRLGQTVRAAQNDADREAASRIYRGFNDWIGQAAEREMLLGNPEAAAALRTARGITKEIKDLFQPKDAAGRTTAGARILSDVLEKADSPERVVQSLFFSGGQTPASIKSGSLEALQNMKAILDKYPAKDVAKQTWDDIRTAYWMKLVQDKKGELFSPKVMLNNIKTAEQSQSSVFKTLYSPEEIAQMVQLKKALETISYVDPNPSGSAVGGAALLKKAIGKLFEVIGGNSKIGQMAVEYSGLNRMYGTVGAKNAVSDAIKTPPVRGLGGASAAAGSIYNRGAD